MFSYLILLLRKLASNDFRTFITLSVSVSVVLFIIFRQLLDHLTLTVQFSYSKPPQIEEIPPEFVEKPKPVAVPEFEPIKIEAKITGTKKKFSVKI